MGIDILMRESLRGKGGHSVHFLILFRIVVLCLNGGFVYLIHVFFQLIIKNNRIKLASFGELIVPAVANIGALIGPRLV